MKTLIIIAAILYALVIHLQFNEVERKFQQVYESMTDIEQMMEVK